MPRSLVVLLVAIVGALAVAAGYLIGTEVMRLQCYALQGHWQ